MIKKKKRLDPNSPEATKLVVKFIKSMTREELAEFMTTYEPGVPHYWLGQPVEPITKEELLAAFSGEDSTPLPKAA